MSKQALELIKKNEDFPETSYEFKFGLKKLYEIIATRIIIDNDILINKLFQHEDIRKNYLLNGNLDATQNFLINEFQECILTYSSYCFTGRFNRAVQTLMTIYDDIYVLISDRDSCVLKVTDLMNKYYSLGLSKKEEKQKIRDELKCECDPKELDSILKEAYKFI